MTKIDDTPTITAREMSEIFEQIAAGITASKMLTEYMEEHERDPEEHSCAFYAGAWWALQEAHMAIEVVLGMRNAGPCADPWDRVPA